MDEFEKLEDEVEEELVCAIGDLVDDPERSTIKDLKPPGSVIRAMVLAAAQVLIAFERGYRMSDE